MRKIPYLNIILFVITIFTTLYAGAYYVDDALQSDPYGILFTPKKIFLGVPFSVTILLILLSHEFSHYFASKRHHTRASLPFFIPGPTIIGTFGAVIKMKSPILTRKALIDIGASGPISGFIVSFIAYSIGLHFSSIVPIGGDTGGIVFGPSILSYKLASIILGKVPEGYGISLHPIAFAGWIGLFITSLNLIPIGQLDGGHIAYAALGQRHKALSFGLVIVLSLMGFFFWPGWIVWGALMLVIGIKHPPVLHWEYPLDKRRRIIGIVCLVIFILTFSPAPFNIVD